MFPSRVRIDLLKCYTMSREDHLKKVLRLKTWNTLIEKNSILLYLGIHLLNWALWVEARTEVPKIPNLFYQCKPIMCCISFSVWPVRRCYTYTNNVCHCCPYITLHSCDESAFRVLKKSQNKFDWCYILYNSSRRADSIRGNVSCEVQLSIYISECQWRTDAWHVNVGFYSFIFACLSKLKVVK